MKICIDDFENTQEEAEFFKNWNFELSIFQKWAIRAIMNNKHALVTAHTGSGKTLPAEAAIIHFTKLGKRIVYTSPIKALTNQKFNEFSKKFPNITFGILTGDNKYDPEAQVLLMTAEIFRNTLFQKEMINASDKKIIVPNLGDHRICMSAFILGILTGAKTIIKNFETVYTSSPSFLKLMKILGAKFETQK